MTTRRHFLSHLAALPVLGAIRPLQARLQDDDDALRAIIASPHRSEANRARDAARHPYDTLHFLGVRPHHTVIEITPGAGWFTEILAPYLRAQGRYIAAHYAHDDPVAYRRKLRETFEARLAARPDLYDKVHIGHFTPQGTLEGINLTDGADRFLTFRNVHNWLDAGHLETSLRAFAHALKAGGVLGIEEHRAAPGVSLDEMKRSGYVSESFMSNQAMAAGFELSGRTEVNANPRDTRDHPHGVWSLPPTLRGGEADKARFLAIGESDRFTHRYIKLRDV